MKYLSANWRTGKGYPSQDKTSADRWSWEFLRRNHQYRKDYETMVRPWIDVYKDCDFDELPLEALVFDPPLLPGETREEWETRMTADKKTEATITTKLAFVGSKWGMHRAIQPEGETIKVGNTSIKRPIIFLYHMFISSPGKYLNSVHDDDDNAVWVRFDLSVKIDAQIERAAERLIDDQKRLIEKGLVKNPSNKLHISKYRDYLRVLDAEDDGAGIKEIASVIFQHLSNEHPDYQANRAVRNYLRAAQKLRDEGWAAIHQG